NEEYERIRKTMPDFGKTVPTPDGPGRVIGINVLSEVVKIKLQTRETPVEYDLDELLEAKELTKKED
ncbi:MAG: signal peptidase, partial [Vagococcus sp.]